MSVSDPRRGSDEERAERAAREMKADLKRAKVLVEEARRRLEGDLPSRGSSRRRLS